MKEGSPKALEVMGTIDEQRQLHLDAPLPLSGPSRVRVIIVFPEEADVADMDEREWLQAAGQNPAFDFLQDPAEDRYTLSDGKPSWERGHLARLQAGWKPALPERKSPKRGGRSPLSPQRGLHETGGSPARPDRERGNS